MVRFNVAQFARLFARFLSGIFENKKYDMGEVHAVINIGDQKVADRGYMPQDQVRRLTVNALVDTGVWTLVINEEICQKLGLQVEETAETIVAGG
jgi:predicted aspartyl protease